MATSAAFDTLRTALCHRMGWEPEPSDDRLRELWQRAVQTFGPQAVAKVCEEAITDAARVVPPARPAAETDPND